MAVEGIIPFNVMMVVLAIILGISRNSTLMVVMLQIGSDTVQSGSSAA